MNKKIKLFGDIGNGFKVVKRITLTIHCAKEDKLWICSDNMFNAYGTGETEKEAIEDYKIALRDLYYFGVKYNSPRKSKEIVKMQKYIKYINKKVGIDERAVVYTKCFT